jgi:uncharacterized membrane protein YdjX (TVP38/TMEM64 family)
MLFIIVIGINYYVNSINLLTLENIKANRDFLINYVSNNLVLSVFAFSTIYIIATSLSIPGAALLSLTGGLIFPFPFSGIIVLTSATIGAFLNFLVSRYLLKDFVKRKFEKPMKKINKELEKNGNNYLLTLRLVPIFPFFLINLAMGLTDMPALKFIIISYIGMAPGSLVYVYAGRNLATIDHMKDIFSPSVLIAFTLLGLFSLLPTVYDKIKKGQQVKK